LTTMSKNCTGAVPEKQGMYAWIRFDNGFSVRPCRIADLSTAGVRLVVEEPHTVAAHFSLLLKRDGAPGRRCRVSWRRGSEIVAEFIGGGYAPAAAAVRVPAASAGTPPARQRPLA
jgi:hypothetical protein